MVPVLSQARSSSQQVCGIGSGQCHAPHCHISWPAARITMSRALSGTSAIFQQVYLALCTGAHHRKPLTAIRRGSKFDGMWLVVGFHPMVLQKPASCNCQVPGLERDAGMLRMGFQYEMPEDTKCVEKRHAPNRSVIYKTCKQTENSEHLE